MTLALGWPAQEPTVPYGQEAGHLSVSHEENFTTKPSLHQTVEENDTGAFVEGSIYRFADPEYSREDQNCKYLSEYTVFTPMFDSRRTKLPESRFPSSLSFQRENVLLITGSS